MENQFLFNKFETVDKNDEPILFARKNKYKVKLSTHYRKNKLFEEKLQAETDTKVVADMKMKRIWESTISRIKGEKVKDDNKLIEKTFKKKKYLKKQKAKKWADRQEVVKEFQKKRFDKRKANIDKRKEEKRNNNIKKLRKKGRLITGIN